MISWTVEPTMNPLVPTVVDGVLMAVSLVALFVALAAFVSLMQSGSPSGWRLLAWTFVVLFVPIIGPATWFVARRRGRPIGPRHVGFRS